MIEIGDYEIEGEAFNRKLVPTDWRYAAAAVGMIRFFHQAGFPYKKQGRKLYYRYEDIYPEDELDQKFLLFVEDYLKDNMHHCQIEYKLKRLNDVPGEQRDALLKEINDKLKANTILKKIFAGMECNGENGEMIQRRIEEHRLELIRQTFANAKVGGYSQFSDANKLRSAPAATCRLSGFAVDGGRKTKALGFCFDKDTFQGKDEVEFDFVMFGFTKGAEAVFINDNISIEKLLNTNNALQKFLSEKQGERANWDAMFYNYMETMPFLAYDVEVIKKAFNTGYFETIFLRESRLHIFREIEEKWKNRDFSLDAALYRWVKVDQDSSINIMHEVTMAILNNQNLDDLIEKLFFLNAGHGILRTLIEVNDIMYKMDRRLEEAMEEKVSLKGTFAAANAVVKYFESAGNKNKIKNYRQKLSSVLVAKDYDRFIEIMLQLSSYTDISFRFLHYLIQDFESNKNLAYNFVNQLVVSKDENKEEGGKKDEE